MSSPSSTKGRKGGKPTAFMKSAIVFTSSVHPHTRKKIGLWRTSPCSFTADEPSNIADDLKHSS